MGAWQFRGKRIAAATARMLLGGLGLDAGSEVLLTGDSAGGVGCLHNADWLHEMLQCAPCHARGTCKGVRWVALLGERCWCHTSCLA